MSAKPRFRIRSTALALIATAIGFLSFASTSLADTGGVYFDAKANAAAGDPNNLFNGSFTGANNVGIGQSVMTSLTNGSGNVAVGTFALLSNTSGSDNAASGTFALISNTTGIDNTATGSSALADNTGSFNVATGTDALGTSTGDSNTAIGYGAGQALTTGSNNIDIGNDGKAGESKAIRIGTKGNQNRAFIAGISGKSITGPTQPVLVNAQGQLGTASASAAKPAASKTATDRRFARMEAEIKRQQRQIERLQREVRKHG